MMMVAVGLAVFAEVAGAVGMEDATIDEFGDGGSGFVGWIELEERGSPEFAFVEFVGHELFDSGIANAEEAFDVATVVLDDFIAEIKDVETGRGCGFDSEFRHSTIDLVCCLICDETRFDFL